MSAVRGVCLGNCCCRIVLGACGVYGFLQCPPWGGGGGRGMVPMVPIILVVSVILVPCGVCSEWGGVL